MLPISIRNYRSADFKDIVAIEREAFAPDNPAYDIFMYLSHGSDFLIVETGREVIGFAALMDAGLDSRIMSFAVKKEHRRKGIGSILLDTVIKKCKEREKTRIVLEVRVSNQVAQDLYKKRGFEIISRIPCYYHDGEDAYFMVLNLTAR